MHSRPQNSKRFTIIGASVLFVLAILMLIPSTSQAIFSALGIAQENSKSVYNGFEPFTPFVPGYFPDGFDIIYVDNDAQYRDDIDTYTETYASADHFFKLVESQGSGVPALTPDPDLHIQDQPASLTSGFDPSLFSADTFDLSTYDTSEVQIVTVSLKQITVQVVTNLPQEEAIQIAEGLVPAICTTKPTQPAE